MKSSTFGTGLTLTTTAMKMTNIKGYNFFFLVKATGLTTEGSILLSTDVFAPNTICVIRKPEKKLIKSKQIEN